MFLPPFDFYSWFIFALHIWYSDIILLASFTKGPDLGVERYTAMFIQSLELKKIGKNKPYCIEKILKNQPNQS